jgi:hypothetical protein
LDQSGFIVSSERRTESAAIGDLPMTTGFPPETYGAAAAILRSYFDAARYNIGIIRADGDAARGSDFLIVEPKPLFAALNHNVDGKNRHCIILSIAGRKRGLLVITDQMFAVHTDIIFATAIIATPRQGKRGYEEIGADFRGRLDTILCNSRLLAETFGHIERVTRDPDALLLILRAYGYAPTDAHFDKACEDAASLRLEQLIKNYEKAVVEAAREVCWVGD